MIRPVCQSCKQNPSAVNYVKDGKHHYRRLCSSCSRKGNKLKPIPPAWFKAGYRKRTVCDHCGWKAKYPDKQMTVFHVDGNLRNNSQFNLKSICLNCRVEIGLSKLPWQEAEVKPDF